MKNNQKTLILLSAAYLTVALIFYGPFLDHFFFFDDFKYLENTITGPWTVALGWGNLRVISNSLWWPLHALSGFNPLGYNLFSILLHSANAIILYLFLARLLRDKELAFFGSAIFLVSSAGCDAIFWKCANSSLVNVFFYLVALINYTVYRQSGSKRHYVLSVLFFAFAMISKEEAASFPLMLLLMEEIFFEGMKEKKAVLLRVMPFALIILIYLLASRIILDYVLHYQNPFSGLLRFSPSYSLLAGLSVFSLNPHNAARLFGPELYLTGIAVVLAYFWVRDKRVFLFGIIWIVFSFLPQSLVAEGNFKINPDNNWIRSVSRYFYITTIGSSVVLASVTYSFKNRFSAKAFYACAATIMAIIIFVNYVLVESRGVYWRDEEELNRVFLAELKKEIPEFPPNSYIAVGYSPMVHSQTLSAIHSYYNNKDINWLTDPNDMVKGKSGNFFLIMCNWKENRSIHLDIKQISNK